MPTRLMLPPLDEETLTDLCARYDATDAADLRLRYQMILLAHQGRSVAEIAAVVFSTRDIVERVLNRFRAGGQGVVPRRFAPGSSPTITPRWEFRVRWTVLKCNVMAA